VTEDPEIVRALINLGEIDLGLPARVPNVRVTRARTAPREMPVILDVEGLLREIRAQYPSSAFVAATSHPSSDPLRSYLEDLGAREDDALLMMPPR
jgi:hypothetical protein